MRFNVICYLPVKNGVKFTEETWGLVDQAKAFANEKVRMIAIVVHSGLSSSELEQLPFDEVYHVKLELKNWKVADCHFQAFRMIQANFLNENEIYFFSSHPLYQEVAVRSATRLGMPIITNAMEVTMDENDSETIIVKREIYKEKAHEFITFLENKQKYLTFENSILYGTQHFGKPTIVQEIDIKLDANNPIILLSESQMDWKELKITEAKVVIGIGRGVYGGASLDSIMELAEIINAPIGGSKVADELGLIPREKRIGASGSSIEADIYIAIGISGSSQHLEGIKGVKHVVAINNDPSAAIFQRCDIGIVGDFQEVIPGLVKSLQAERKSVENVEHVHIG